MARLVKLFAILLVVILAGCIQPEATPSVAPSPSVEPTVTIEPSPTITPTPEPSVEPEPSPEAAPSPSPEAKLLVHLPWTAGEAWRLSTQWHDEGALDFYTVPYTRKLAVRAVADGTVVYATHSHPDSFNTYGPEEGDELEDMGNFVVVSHGGAYSVYAHFLYESQPPVRAGDSVAAGERLGWMGNTGWSHGEHLHFSIVKGIDFLGQTFIPMPRDAWGFRELNGSNGMALEQGYVSQNTAPAGQ